MPWKTISGPEGNFKTVQPPAEAPQMSIMDRIKDLPAAYRDVVVGQIKAGDPSVLSLPAVQPMILDLLKTHPDLAKFAGATGGTILGTPGGPLTMIAGGASGASIMDSAAQLAQMGTPEAPQSTKDALLRSGGAVAEGALTGAMGAGAASGAPKVLRFAASPAGGGLVAGGTTLYKTGDPLKAVVAAGATASGLRALPGISKLAAKLATKLEAMVASAANSSGAAKAEAVIPVVKAVLAEDPAAVPGVVDTLVGTGWSKQDAEKYVADALYKLGGKRTSSYPSLAGLPGVVEPKVAQVAPAVVGKAGELSQEQLKMVMQLQAMAKQGGQSRQAVARAAKEMFPNNPEVIEMITGPITRMPSVSIPR